MNRRESKDQEQFVNDAYENFQELYTTVLNDPKVISILAEERGTDSKNVYKEYTATLLINNAYKNYRLRSNGFIPDDLWGGMQKDMKELFSWRFVQERWQKTQKFYSVDFREFVQKSLTSKNFSTPNTKHHEIKSSSRH